MVFYRKYRPQKIEELDSASVRENLYSIFSKGNYPHAFLFTGPKGLGKTSAARIVAKIVNCEKKAKGKIEPCNKCDQCQSIASGSNLDVLEIDGASNRGIDEIRDLREKIKLAPFKASKKVYIIDEVHMLTTEAFNALLKTLEEPPAHVLFILCTTEQHKVPATIASRCFRINFTRANR
jgi:DNA polymerase-3 subunit gamma/tau